MIREFRLKALELELARPILVYRKAWIKKAEKMKKNSKKNA
jgi:hypothetical protein